MRRDLIAEGFDIAIRMGPGTRNSATSRKFFQVQRRLVAAASYLANHPAVSEPRDLADWKWLALMPVQNKPLTVRGVGDQTRTIKPDVAIRTNDAQALYRLARSGAGLGIVPEFLAEKDAAAGVVEYVLPDWKVSPLEVFAVWPANAPKHGLVHLALNALSMNVAKDGPDETPGVRA